MRKFPQRLHEHGVEVVALQASRGDGDGLAGVVRDPSLVADVALGVLHGRDDGIQVVSLYLGRLVDDDDLGAVAAHGTH